MCFQPYTDSAKLCLNITTFKAKRTSPSLAFRGPMLLEVFAKKGTYTPDKIELEYEPKELSRWSDGVMQGLVKLRFVSDKTDFIERVFTADIELEDHTPVVYPTENLKTFTSTMKRSDIPAWRAKCRGFQMATENIDVECQWGMPKEHRKTVNQTEKSLQREYFVKFVSDRWILPTQTVHNMTLLWADVPEWLRTVGQTYKTWAPMVKKMIVWNMTPWDLMVEPKQSWIENSYTVCLKTKSNDTMDLIFVMPYQEITITNMTSPVHTQFLKRPLPTIVNSIIRPNITIIPPPKTCHMHSSKVMTFDNVTVNYTMPSTCPHILVKDCSSDERFTVLVQNITLREEADTVKSGLKSIVYVDKHKFEFVTD
ncbi:uncharacterized protein [Amphiura filiformis]|uniref:uncharacterized protein n=1 Tax=Amphiura filiformis TaxID=82378 RepID=UPI003B216E51